VPPTIQKMLEFARQQKSNADSLAGNVNSLIGKGLSKDLLRQLAGQGQAGFDQIAALASGTAADIDQFNALNAQTNKTLENLGLAVWETTNPEKNGQIKALNEQIASAHRQEEKLERIANRLDKDDKIEIRGSDLVILLRRLEKAEGKKYLAS
jgi:hypothetical protein